LIEQKPKSILVVFGPEGGLTDHEQQRLEEQGFIGYRLTPSVLRSTEAITVGLGILRSLMF
jgi:16S rRNA (uracil1498-N3)-methyltransferase